VICDKHVYLWWVCLSVSVSQGNHMYKLQQCSVHAAVCGHGLVLLKRHYNTLIISGFVDDDMFFRLWNVCTIAQQHHCNVIHGLALLPHGAGCILQVARLNKSFAALCSVPLLCLLLQGEPVARKVNELMSHYAILSTDKTDADT